VKAAVAQEISAGMTGNGRVLGAGADHIGISPPLTREDVRAAHLMGEAEHSLIADTGWQSIAEKGGRDTGEAPPYSTRQERETLLDAYLDAVLTVDGPSWAIP